MSDIPEYPSNEEQRWEDFVRRGSHAEPTGWREALDDERSLHSHSRGIYISPDVDGEAWREAIASDRRSLILTENDFMGLSTPRWGRLPALVQRELLGRRERAMISGRGLTSARRRARQSFRFLAPTGGPEDMR